MAKAELTELKLAEGVCMNPPRLNELQCQDCQYWGGCTNKRRNPKRLTSDAPPEVQESEETSYLPKFKLPKVSIKSKKGKKRKKGV